MRWKAIGLSVAFPAFTWFVGGGIGLILGVAIVVSWWVWTPHREVYWALAALFLVVAPVALYVGGLPKAPVVGAQFGVDHLLAHRIVTAALTFAAFAAVAEILALEGKRRLRVGAYLLATLRTRAAGDGGRDEAPRGAPRGRSRGDTTGPGVGPPDGSPDIADA